MIGQNQKTAAVKFYTPSHFIAIDAHKVHLANEESENVMNDTLGPDRSLGAVNYKEIDRREYQDTQEDSANTK